MILTELIVLAVLALEMKNVNGQPHVLKERVVFDSLRYGAIVVKKNMIRLCACVTVCLLDHLLLVCC
jgi:hypothetical protein